MKNIPSLAEERWRIVRRDGRWVVRFEPLNHTDLWRDLADFATKAEAIAYLKTWT
jgi:hypothetical protein